MILSQALNNAALKNPNAAAILDLGKTISYGELRKRVGQLSYLYQAEVGHGLKVAFLSQNNPAFVLTFFAMSNIGNTLVLLDPAESNESIVEALKDLEITHICVSGDQLSRVNELIRTQSLNLQIIEMEKKKGGEYDPSYSPPPDHPLKESDTVLVLRHREYGEEKKYIYFNHKQLYLASTNIRKFYHLLGSDKVFTTLSWAQPYALTHSLLMPLFYGCTCAINPQAASSEEFIEYLAQNHITRFVDVSRFYYQLLMICKNAKYTLPGVKSISAGMGQLPISLRKTFQLLKIAPLQCFGRVECVYTYAMEDSEKSLQNEKPKAMALPGFKYKVLDDAGDEIPGEGRREGVFAFTSESVMQGFFHPDKKLAEKATKLSIRGTWHYTGLVARLEGSPEELLIQPLGKESEVIKNGKTFATAENIDRVAKEINDVIDAAGFVRQNMDGQSQFAVAVVRQGKILSEATILEHCQSKLSAQEQPKTVHFTDLIPKDEFDTVNRLALQRQFSGF